MLSAALLGLDSVGHELSPDSLVVIVVLFEYEAGLLVRHIRVPLAALVPGRLSEAEREEGLVELEIEGSPNVEVAALFPKLAFINL